MRTTEYGGYTELAYFLQTTCVIWILCWGAVVLAFWIWNRKELGVIQLLTRTVLLFLCWLFFLATGVYLRIRGER